jgi:methylated-DNA-protein-cysteine methyltransferase-like protein
MARDLSESYRRIYGAVRRIPRGRVATYGQIAHVAGLGGQPRLVGYALHALREESAVPWHRVINAQGRLSLLGAGSGAGLTQRMRLEGEGVRFTARGRVDLDVYGWRPGEKTKRPGRRTKRPDERTRR